MKRLIIGDIHGCYDELMDLVDRAGLADDDEIIALGDLADRGPHTERVIAFFNTRPQARALMGNHEHKHLLCRQGVIQPDTAQVMTRDGMSQQAYADFIATIQGYPLYLELEEAVLVHGALAPETPITRQPKNVLLGTRNGEAYLRSHYPRPWYQLYTAGKPVIAGHRDYSGKGEVMVVNERVYLIDTGCCYGKSLSGILLPDFRILQVPSRRNYWGVAKQRYLASLRK